MLLQLLARFTPFHAALTPEEREAIYRFRYSIYAQELRRDYPGTDHQRRMLAEPEDELPETRLFYTGSRDQVTGTLRARIWDAPPGKVVEELSLQRVPPGMRIAWLERMMVRSSLRGRAPLPALIWHGYQRLMEERVDICVLTCVPGLARSYLRLGARPYGARLVEGASSPELPMMIVMNDPAYLKSVGSFMYPQMRRLARPFDPAPLAPLFDPRAQPVVFDPSLVADELARVRPALFQGVGPLGLRTIAESAFVVQLEAGDLVVRRGTADREMYLVLQGELDVEGRVRIREGETMGEMAFLGTPGVRTATVHATARSRLLVLRRRFLDELAAVDVRAAYNVARNLSRVAADRFTERISQG
jgi:hypothetical protein